MIEVRTNATLSGHAWGLVGPGRAVYVVTMGEAIRMAERAVQDQRDMFEDPNEALDAALNYFRASMLDLITPEG